MTLSGLLRDEIRKVSVDIVGPHNFQGSTWNQNEKAQFTITVTNNSEFAFKNLFVWLEPFYGCTFAPSFGLSFSDDSDIFGGITIYQNYYDRYLKTNLAPNESFTFLTRVKADENAIAAMFYISKRGIIVPKKVVYYAHAKYVEVTED